ncbi:MAG TPA: sugar porter family MFS transporter [Bacteroidota bacterium]|nr:sugar porter family MFS transporter [Bacteroidota bacterium]
MKTTEGLFLLGVSAVAALGGLLFGFDTAVISGAIPFIRIYFKLNDIMLGWTVSSLLIGCIAGVLVSGRPADIFGRKKTLLVSALLFLVSAAGSASATVLWVFIVFRFTGGIAVGIASMMSPMYIAEISPASHRGKLVSLNQLAIVIGILAAFFSNYLLVDTGLNNWRWMLAVMGAPAVLFFASLVFVPESPRWLVQKGKMDEAFRTLERISGSSRAREEISEIRGSLGLRSKSPLREIFSRHMSAVVWVGIIVAVFQQITGINSIMYYAPMIFAKTGTGMESALLQTAAVGAVNLLCTLIAIRYIDRIGRKPLLIAGTLGMTVSLFALAFAFSQPDREGAIVLGLILFYIASFAASLGPVTWVFIAEIYPNRLRGEAMSVAIVVLWSACFLVSLVFPAMLNTLGGGSAFFVFGIMCVLYLVFIIVKVPETKGKSLEELEHLLVSGSEREKK